MIICLAIAIIIIIAWIVFIALGFKDDTLIGIEVIICGVMIVGLVDSFLILPFLALDKSSGTTIGTITAVDKTFWGTTKLYIKTTENNEDSYCIENEEISNQAKELLGKRVQLYYGERVGLYHLNQCRIAPIEKIDEVQDEKGTN